MVQFLLALMRLGRQDVAGEGMVANHFATARLLETFRRTFVCLEFRHKKSRELTMGKTHSVYHGRIRMRLAELSNTE
jgi:hypothetical protein